MSCFSSYATPRTAGVVFVLIISLIIFWVSKGYPSSRAANGEELILQNNTTGNIPCQYVESEKRHMNNLTRLESTLSPSLMTEQYEVSGLPDGALRKSTEEDNNSIVTKIDDLFLLNHNDSTAYVIPLKINENQYEDPPDEQSELKRHHSGNFRLPTASVWDPHPQYVFTAFGRTFRLRLAHNSNFLSPDVKVTHIKKNETVWENPKHQLRCFYKGKIDGDTTSDVSVSLCHGMTGHVRTSSDSYTIEPAENWRKENGQILKHIFHRESKNRSNGSNVSATDIRTVSKNHGVIDYEIEDEAPVPLIDESSAGEIYVGDRHRKRRSSIAKIIWDDPLKPKSLDNRFEPFTWNNGSPSRSVNDVSMKRTNEWNEFADEAEERLINIKDPSINWRNRRSTLQKYYIEIMVVADQKMMEYHGSGLIHYILVLLSTVHRIYKDPSIGNPINIAVMKIVQVDRSFGSRHKGTNGISAAEMLRSFCKWQKMNNPNEPSAEHHDAALLLTRENLCQDPEQHRCETLGLAELGGMCSFGSSCAIVQDNGLPTAFTIAHEIGHVLNMPHDDDSKCKKFQIRSDVHNFMTRRLDNNSFRWEWSKCSRHYITEFLENASCLLDEPNNVITTPDGIRLPGEDYSGNKQCELVFGRGSKICTHRVEDVCKRLWCTIGDDTACHTQNMPWADGTPCSNDQSTAKWCRSGECVSAQNLEPISGQWGQWGPFSECSRTCGGGIQRRYRECNGPPPQNGGDYCIGERIDFRSCATNECPSDSLDFREEQCSAFNNNNLKIRGLDNNTEWHAKYTTFIPEDRCKLYCQVESKQYYMLRDKVIDGTPCAPDTFDVCVHGHCKPAGCDHILNSTAEIDTCGVCRGDNSMCQGISGMHNTSHYGYTRVIKIPAGSSNIDIKQHGWVGSHNDSNYLALRLGEGGKYILNGNFTIMHRKVIIHPGITIEYSGPETLVERLNTSRPITVDIILEVLSVGKVHPPQITYRYTVPKNILKNYKWVLSDWSECSYVCRGMKYRKAQCHDTKYNEAVSDDYCEIEQKPQEEKQQCNNYCSLEWKIVEISECSNHCGPGNRTISSQCIQTLTNRDGESPEPVAFHACSHLKRPPNFEPCNGPCDYAHWSYGKWGICSVTCNDGIQSRTANCVDASGKIIPDSECIASEKVVMRTCGEEPCPKWSFGEWSACSVTCGVGERIRPIWCHVENRIVAPELCNNATPEVHSVCDSGPCRNRDAHFSKTANSFGNGDSSESSVEERSFRNNEVDPISVNFRPSYKWQSSPYGECDTECGEGRRYRQVDCKDIEGKVTSDVNCFPAKKPKLSKKCVRKICGTSIGANGNTKLQDGWKLRWRVSNWTPCSRECGGGFQKRAVTCRRINGFGWIDPSPADGCSYNKRPKSERKCKLRECDDHYYWTTGKWRKCSHSCGRNGKQTRRLFCRDANGKKRARFHCPDKFKPKQERKCNHRRCGAKTCLEAQKRLKTMNDGEYTLLIGGKYMKIYCLNAATNYPREYLTLPAGGRKNYAEVYDKRLLNPNECPFNGRRNSTCECISDVNGISGLTYFSRVRINPVTLMIIADDYTFSWTKGAKRVEFGKAGDCYSNVNCPQGRFSIDLTGTLLRLSSDVLWTATKSKAFLNVNTINDQKVTGKCGGYCGFCTPKSGLKLDVLPP